MGQGRGIIEQEERMKFKIGDRVRVIDEKLAQHYCPSDVRDGDEGVVANCSSLPPEIKISRLNHTYYIPERGLKLIAEEPQVPVVYKQVAVRDGKYWSSFVGVPNSAYSPGLVGLPALEYKVGEVTTSPTLDGIFCHRDRALALQRAKDRADVHTGLSALLECYPIGVRTGSGFCNYPAVYVLRELWREEEEPKEKWVDVTDECTVYLMKCGVDSPNGAYIEVDHRGVYVLGLGGKRCSVLATDPRYKVELLETRSVGGFKVFKRG